MAKVITTRCVAEVPWWFRPMMRCCHAWARLGLPFNVNRFAGWIGRHISVKLVD